MEKPVVFMFSGQGSQYYQMGKDLFDQNPVFRKWMLRLDEKVYSLIGESVLAQLYDDTKRRDDIFDRTLYTHPAIFMVEYALAQALMESGIKPDYCLGSSLGEFVAAAVAGIMPVEELLQLVVEQATLYETYCQKGSMLAILHNPDLYDQEPLLHRNSELVAVNFHSHFVIAGSSHQLQRMEDYVKGKGIICQRLPVSYAFHSSYIDPAEPHYREVLKQKSFGIPQIPFVSCVHGEIMKELPGDYFWQVVRKPMQLPKAVQELEKQQSYVYLDLGPAGNLSNFTKRNLRQDSQSECYSIITPFKKDGENVERIKQLFSKKRLNTNRKEGRKMTTYVFPGQGSQIKGMGGSLFDEFPEITAKADRILGYSIKELCLHDPDKQLSKTQFTQPALYVVNALSYLKKVKETGKKPDYVAGHSLGEYNALFASGVFDFETGLHLVKKRGELMSQAVGGGMAAVIGFTLEQVERVLHENHLTSIDIANHNSPSQFVIAGRKEDIERANPVFQEAGVKVYIPLKVSGAFHSRYMSDAKQNFENYLNQFAFSNMTIPVISNVHARPYKQSDVKRNLVEQITHPVKWNDSIRYLLAVGENEIEEVGPGTVLTKLVTTIRNEAEPLIIEVEEEKENMEQEAEPVSIAVQAEEISSTTEQPKEITAFSLGNQQFKQDYKLKYPYLAGAMYKGISSERLVVKMGKAGMMGFFGSGGLQLDRIERAIQQIQRELQHGEPYGMNLLHHPSDPSMEERIVDLYLAYQVRVIEASAFMAITPALIIYRAKGLKRGMNGKVEATNKIFAKVSQPEVAEAFLSPAPEYLIEKLVQEQKLTREEAILLREVPMADELTVEADSGGNTDHGVASALMPAMIRLRDNMMHKYGYRKPIRIGAAGGIGTPEAAAVAFMLGADYIVTGSINQCTVEAATSESVKDSLQLANVQDTEYAPAGEMFEMGAKIQVLKKGLFFPARANKLHDLYRQYNSLDEIDEKTKQQLQEKYFKRSFEEVYEQIKTTCPPQELKRAERTPKYKMALLFKWYFHRCFDWALDGAESYKVDYQIYCGPALGSFNQWVKGTAVENWRDRHVDQIGEMLLKETANLLNQRIHALIGSSK